MENKTTEQTKTNKRIVGVDESERVDDAIPMYYLTAAVIPEEHYLAFTRAWATLIQDYAAKAPKGSKLALRAKEFSCRPFLKSALKIAAQYEVQYVILPSIAIEKMPPDLTKDIPARRLDRIRTISKLSGLNKTPYHGLFVTLLGELNRASQAHDLSFEVFCDSHQDYESWQDIIAESQELLPHCTVKFVPDQDAAIVQLADIAGWYFGRAARDSIEGKNKSKNLTMSQKWIEPFIVNTNAVLEQDSVKLWAVKQMSEDTVIPISVKPIMLGFGNLIVEAAQGLPLRLQRQFLVLVLSVFELLPQFANRNKAIDSEQIMLKEVMTEMQNWAMALFPELYFKYQAEISDLIQTFPSLPSPEEINESQQELIKSYLPRLKPILQEVLSDHLEDFLKFGVRIKKAVEAQLKST